MCGKISISKYSYSELYSLLATSLAEDSERIVETARSRLRFPRLVITRIERCERQFHGRPRCTLRLIRWIAIDRGKNVTSFIPVSLLCKRRENVARRFATLTINPNLSKRARVWSQPFEDSILSRVSLAIRLRFDAKKIAMRRGSSFSNANVKCKTLSCDN